MRLAGDPARLFKSFLIYMSISGFRIGPVFLHWPPYLHSGNICVSETLYLWFHTFKLNFVRRHKILAPRKPGGYFFTELYRFPLNLTQIKKIPYFSGKFKCMLRYHSSIPVSGKATFQTLIGIGNVSAGMISYDRINCQC